MQVTPELLIKYHQQVYSAEERLAVEAWLETDDLFGIDGPALFEADELKAAIWQGIHRGKASGKRMYIQRYWPWLAAACFVAVALMVSFYPFLLSKTISFDNNSPVARIFSVDRLQLQVQPHSKGQLVMPLLANSPARIVFSGAISVTSKMKNLQVNIASNNQPGDGKGSDAVKLREGQVYMAMTDPVYNLIAATQEELQDGLPRLFSNRLTERF
jgi:hypothetical protein